ncbi:Pep3/Vps18/deep orange family-domain-containing protein [Schizophyllum amplum]|uniref:Pep3/Vps18/deep orange family-domain-containing protein n=1 Tax=Schizophyllum amplum TaxID=97359 RepID=A0A550CNN8_9AGAR|nr:Pep3/Vps18/deep orange family-domain-containing protein [Auriculariopsis ampla]
MFDDFVEHAAFPPGVASAASALPSLQYEGFEPSPFTADDDRAEIEEASLDVAAVNEPIFELGRVQYTFPAPLISFAVSSDMLVMALSNNTIVLIELSHSEQVVQIPIPRKPQDMSIHKVFIDPSGRHIIVSSTQGENWYLFRAWKKTKQPKLLKWKMVIESIAWNKVALLASMNSTSTREMLIGARSGTIFEAVIDAEENLFASLERHLQSVYTVPGPITGIHFSVFPPQDPRKTWIVVTTPSRMYQFVGTPDRRSDDGSRVFAALFNTYRDNAPNIRELPGNIQHSELHFYTPNSGQAQSLPKTVAWLTGSGIFHGSVNLEASTDDLVDGVKLPAYPTFADAPPGQVDVPLSMAVTEFHFVLLYKDRIAAICSLDERLAYEEILPVKPTETVRGLAADPVRGTYWVFSDQSLFELGVGNDDRDVWKVFMEQGHFDVALRYVKTASQRDHVLSAQAASYFAEGKFFQSAQCYAQCSVSFEEVALKFLDANERDALRSYLISRLERTRKSDLTQRLMLSTWLVEFYLSKCNEMDDLIASESVSQDVNNLEAERTMLEDDLRHFFETYKADLDTQTVYELIQGHGRTDMYLFYATSIGDFERVVQHWTLEEEWAKAIDVISRQPSLELYYQFSTVLMRNAPKETVDAWLKQPALDPLRLIPALLQVQHAPRDPLMPNQAVRYLTNLIFEEQNTNPTIHNLLITFYVSPSSPSTDDDGPLLRYLSTAPTDPMTGKPYYDLDYALRLCKQSGRTQPCKGDVELAKINADMPQDDEPLRKKLWLKIAQYVVQDKKDIKTAVQFLESTNILKIEDILPFFPDFVVIDDFKEEITHALEGYSAHIDTLKQEMDDATETADAIKQDISMLKNRFVTISAGDSCSQCGQLLLTRQFYVFPCHHSFHADCLIGLAKEYLPGHALRRMLALQNELIKGTPALAASRERSQTAPRALLSSNFANAVPNPARAANLLGRNILNAGDKLRDMIVPDALAAAVTAPAAWIPGMGGAGTGKKRSGADKTDENAKKARAELEELLASNCPLCESVVVGLDKGFIKEGELDTSWAL